MQNEAEAESRKLPDINSLCELRREGHDNKPQLSQQNSNWKYRSRVQ